MVCLWSPDNSKNHTKHYICGCAQVSQSLVHKWGESDRTGRLAQHVDGIVIHGEKGAELEGSIFDLQVGLTSKL